MTPAAKHATDEATYLANYRINDYPATLVTVDVAIFTIIDKQLKLLVIQRENEPCKGQTALPGGFIHHDKDKNLDDSASRILFNKTGVRLAPTSPYLEQIKSVASPNRDPRGWSITVLYFALIAPTNTPLAAGAQWVNALTPDMALAFDHSQLLKLALDRIRNKASYSMLPSGLMPEKFSLAQLQQVFELLLGRAIQNKSFRRRIMASGTIEALNETTISGKRPAQLYRIKQSQPITEGTFQFSTAFLI
jgi:8-oxo-dGTP diphosphatase